MFASNNIYEAKIIMQLVKRNVCKGRENVVSFFYQSHLLVANSDFRCTPLIRVADGFGKESFFRTALRMPGKK